MNNRAVTIVNLAAGLLLCLLILGQLGFKNNDKKSSDTTITYRPPALPKTMTFAGEDVPLDRWDVKERLDRELLFNYYNKANVLFLIKLANRYFPLISERLKANDVPDDFKYLCIAESNLLSGAVSRSGAVGFWQFMDGTAPGFGLEVNSQVDYRHDVIKSTDAACKYLKIAYAKFGSWTGAAASYNCGQGGYNGQATYQGTYNYYDLLLPEETNRYIFRILAFKHLLENATELGFVVEDEEKYGTIPSRTVTVTSSIPNLAQFAQENGTTYKMLRQMNPWLRGRSLTVSGGKTYEIKLPER
ncbi:MAG: lytic transglycosylase domain-containing protein [Flavisolibacter sp.]|nr:lytic transglycosylase domain-containing protein [Flavisolibacter sp.]MBD0377284.1 lytic transglycosylase domain-containing protein [Flavisolibacter sp.]